MKNKNNYPECEKMNEVANVHTTLNEFIEWLYDNGFSIQHYETKSRVNRSTIVYDFMKIDPAKVEKERREMLAALSK